MCCLTVRRPVSLPVRVLLMTLAALLLPAIAAAQVSDPVLARAMQGPPQVDPRLLDQLHVDDSARVLVFLRERPALGRAATMPWRARGAHVVEALQTTARRSQGRILALLQSRRVEHEAFWVDNVIVVPAASAELVEALRGFDEVALLAAAPEIVLYQPEPADSQNAPAATESNLVRVKAPQAWALGITGAGITVASIDTGVRYTHEALVGSYRGNTGAGFDHAYNWRNPYDLAMTAPADSHDHGSHVTGTMTGDDGNGNQIGIAPGAYWIACRGFNPGWTDAGLLACAQYLLAPTDLDDENPDPARRPHIVNNSWGDCGQSYNGWYQGAIDSWHAAGIYPVFASGNAPNCGYSSPPGLSTVGNPARYGNVTAVGATGQSNGLYASYSNWGPTDNLDTVNPASGHANLKPQVLAPGTGIRSSTRGSDSSYANFSGTSMSAPHVAGLVALVWQAAPCLVGQYSTTELVLETAVTPLPYASNHGTEGPGNVPNHATGWGEIDALAAVTLAQALCGETGTLSGTVTAAGSGLPLAGAVVSILGDGLPSVKATTDSSGAWSREVPAGSYGLEVRLLAYFTATIADVAVVADETTIVDVQLVPRAQSIISGVVTDAGGQGWPLYARIDITGYSGSPVFSDPQTGAYSVWLLEGEGYDFSVSALLPGWLPQQRSVSPPPGGATEDFALAVDAGSCAAPGYAVDYVYFEDFDQDDGGYTVSYPSSWAHGVPTSGPGAAVSLPNVWATNLGGDYGNNENGYLTSPTIDLSAHAGSSPVLQWRQWLRTESSWDFASVEVSSDNGGSWTRVYGETSGDVSPAWTLRRVALAQSNAVSEFRVRFRLRSDTTVVRPGWYIDNVGIGMSDYLPGDTLLSESFEGTTFPPTGWIRHNLDGGGTQWQRSNLRASNGVNSARHDFSNAGNQDGWLVAPSIEVHATGGELGFSEYTALPTWYGKHSLWACAASCDTPPTNYTQLREFGAPLAQWREQSIDLGGFAGQTMRFAFRYEGNGAADWFIDAVRITTPSSGSSEIACSPVAGGLLAGQVSDLNTGSPLVGALVEAPGTGARTISIATPADPALADGFYQLFVPGSGSTELVASRDRYADQTELVNIVAGAMAQDFALAAPQLELAPTTLTVRIPAAHGGSVPVELINVGTSTAAFTLTEYAGHAPIGAASREPEAALFPATAPVDTQSSAERNRIAIDLPWLSQTPASGVLPAQDIADITLHFDAGSLAAGSYHATVAADNDGPYAPPSLLVTMEVVDAPPVVEAVFPDSGLVTGGLAITVSGSNFFLAYAGASEVKLGALDCLDVAVVDSGTITCTTPAHAAGSVDVTVTNPGGQSAVLVDGFGYVELAPPVLDAVAPAQGPVSGGTAVTLSGDQFQSAGSTSVQFGSAACTDVVVVDSGTITCTTPAHAAGEVEVTVTNPDGQSVVLVDGFRYVELPPFLTAVTPTQGFTRGGTRVTVQGGNLLVGGTTVVGFGGAACTGVTVVDSETLTCTTPAQAAGTVDLSVTNPDGQGAVLAAAFTYVPAPDAIFRDGFE
jgi:subtilisin family serine protease